MSRASAGWRRFPSIVRHEAGNLFQKEILLYLAVLPIVGMLAFGTLYFRRIGREYPVAVLDLDSSYASRLATFYLDSAPELRVTSVGGDEGRARELLRRGEVLAVVRLPHRLMEMVKRRHPVQADVWVDSRNLVAANSVLTGLQKALGTGMAGARLILFKKLMPAGAAWRELQPVRVVHRPLGNPSLDYSFFLLTAIMLLLIQQCILVGSAVGLAGETERGTLPGSVAAAGGPLPYSLGRMLAVWLIQLPPLAGVLAIYGYLFSMPLRQPLSLILLLTLFAAAAAALAQVLGGVFRRRLTVLQALVFFSMPAFLLSGYTWPRENTPLLPRLLAECLPSTPALNAFPRLNTLGATSLDLAPWFLRLAVQLVVYLGLGAAVLAWRLRRESRPDRPGDRGGPDPA